MKSFLDKLCLLEEAEVLWQTRSKAVLGFVCSCLQKWNSNTDSICLSSLCMQRKLSRVLPSDF